MGEGNRQLSLRQLNLIEYMLANGAAPSRPKQNLGESLNLKGGNPKPNESIYR